MYKIITSILITLSPVMAVAQTNLNHKLIVLRGQYGVAITDYPTAAKCEAAKITLDRLVQRENTGKQPFYTNEGVLIIPSKLELQAYCLSS